MNAHRWARVVIWLAVVLGVVGSVAANIAHARPELGPRLASAFAPVALLLTVEIMSRVPWPEGAWWAVGRWFGAGTVALVAAVTSYRHMSALLRSYGEDELTAAIQPASVDGLMIVASLALVALGTRHQASPPAVTAPAAPAPTAAPAPARPARAVVPVAGTIRRTPGTSNGQTGPRP